ncbi:MAG: PAS domain-containing protein [Alphaproteobacteria bacterium]|nr:PAS domain-containing protein [Alphaproteobacteria bacterium]
MPDNGRMGLNLGEQIAVSDLTMARVREGFAYWDALRAGRPMPTRAEVNPTAIPQLLPYILLIGVNGPGDFEFRLMGGASTEAHGFNPTGWNLRDLENVREGYGRQMVAFLQWVVDRAEPGASRGTLAHVDKGFRTFELVYLPLGPQGGPIDFILGFADYATKKD